MVSRGRGVPTTETIYRLFFEPKRKKAYLSFPMSHVMDLPETLAEIERFKRTMNEHFICFDPADVDEFCIHTEAVKAMQEGRTTIEVHGTNGRLTLKTADVAQISGDILGQIYARDFKMVDQSDMIVSLIPELPTANPPSPAASNANSTTPSKAARKCTSSGNAAARHRHSSPKRRQKFSRT